MKNILITGANSDIALALIEILKAKGEEYSLFCTSRRNLKLDGVKNFYLDMCEDSSFEALGDELCDVKFDVVINFAGIATASPVALLSSEALNMQLDICVTGLGRLLKFVYPRLNRGAKVINLSSMAAFGLFPFISPYCLSKAAGDILLNAFEMETGIRTVSIKPGVVRTKFWEYCIELNKENFDNFGGEFKETGEFLLENARKNVNRGLFAGDVAKVIYKAICARRPWHSYLIGFDAKMAALSAFLPKGILNSIVRFSLKRRTEEFIKNGK